MPHPTIEASLWQSWFDAARDASVGRALLDVFDALNDEINSLKPTCWLSGKCCKFDTYGHKLYVTGLEIAYTLNGLSGEHHDRLRQADLPTMDGCPFQVNGLCGVHALRPLGCRVYFCDTTAQHWQNEIYEKFLTRLRTLHETHALEYRYMEWRTGLDEARRWASETSVSRGRKPAVSEGTRGLPPAADSGPV